MTPYLHSYEFLNFSRGGAEIAERETGNTLHVISIFSASLRLRVRPLRTSTARFLLTSGPGQRNPFDLSQESDRTCDLPKIAKSDSHSFLFQSDALGKQLADDVAFDIG